LQSFNYRLGDEIAFIADNKTIGVVRGEKGLVIETRDNNLTVQVGDRTVSFGPDKYQRFRTYERVEREFSTGDQVVFLKNDNTLGVRNGTMGTVVAIEEASLKIETAKGIKEINLSSYNHLDYGYALTVHKSQGQTVDRVIVNIDTKQERSNNANSFYVAISRAREGVTVYTDSRDELPSSVGRWQEKESTLDYMAREAEYERAAGGLDRDFERGDERQERDIDR